MRVYGVGVLVAVAVLAGCIEANLVPCGDRFCPRGSVCVGGSVCATFEQVDACDGLADGDSCTIRTGGGVCQLGVCVATGCGNGMLEGDEACDDGNVVGADGCSADCKKVEVCGDGILDEGEPCDDGNTSAVDGCDMCVQSRWLATAKLGGNTLATSIGLGAPTGIAVDRAGAYYIGESDAYRVSRVDASGIVTTVAGNGTRGMSGDGGPATHAQFRDIGKIVLDDLGNIYIADTGNHCVRRVSPSGVITTVAGSGSGVFGGDGGLATAAGMSGPSGIAIDGIGNLYLADHDNHRVRRVDPNGIITTIAGTGTSGFSGDGGPATAAMMTWPTDVAVSGTDVYITDGFNSRIRKVSSTGTITTIAGGGSSTAEGVPATTASLPSPGYLSVDRAGNLYVTISDRIRRIDTAGIITTIAGREYGDPNGYGGDGGPALDATFVIDPRTAFDDLGRMYLADRSNNRIRRVDSAGIITTIAGNGTSRGAIDGLAATSAVLQWPSASAVDAAGNLFVVDTDGSRVVKIATDGTISRIAGIGNLGYFGDGGPATLAAINTPYGIAVDPAGNVYIADTLNDVIRRVDTAGTITTYAGTGSSGFSGDGGPATSADIDSPLGMAYDDTANRLVFADSFNKRLRAVDAAGTISTIAGGGISTTDDVPATSALITAIDGVAVSNGNIYYSDISENVVRRINSNGLVRTVAGNGTTGYSGNGGPATSAQLDGPNSIAASGGELYIAEIDNNVLRKVDANGVISLIAGDGVGGDRNDGAAASGARVSFPEGVAVRGGNIYVSDSANGRCRRIASDGTITTIAGRVDPEGAGPTSLAQLADPRAIVVSPSLTLVAGGESGTVEAIRGTTLAAVAGRYPHSIPTGALARFRESTFGSVGGVAYDATTGRIFFTETSANRLHVVTIVDPANERTWTIAPLSLDTTIGGRDGTLATARFRNPTGLHFDAATKMLYVADTGNHAIRAIDLSAGIGSTAAVTTIAGSLSIRGFFGDGGAATAALLYAPVAVTRCPNGDLFIADTSNHRVRRVAAGTQTIATVLGDGVAASSGEGVPATTFPVHAPAGVTCDATNNLFVTSSTTVRLLPSNNGVVDGTGPVQTIYGAAPRDQFPASVTTCLTGIAVVDATTVQTVDSCTGVLVELKLTPGT